jgi:hypothetical protein
LKTLIKLLLFILAAILAGLLVARPAIAEAPKPNNPYDIIKNDEFIGPIQLSLIKDNAIQPILPSSPVKTTNSEVTNANVRGNQPIASSYNGQHYTKEEVIQLIKDYSAQYGISADLPLRIAKCESGYRWDAKNKNSSASGVFEYLSSTWAGTDEGKAGLSVFNADANVRAAIKYIASRGHAQPWLASKSCWS